MGGKSVLREAAGAGLLHEESELGQESALREGSALTTISDHREAEPNVSDRVHQHPWTQQEENQGHGPFPEPRVREQRELVAACGMEGWLIRAQPHST